LKHLSRDATVTRKGGKPERRQKKNDAKPAGQKPYRTMSGTGRFSKGATPPSARNGREQTSREVRGKKARGVGPKKRRTGCERGSRDFIGH